MVKNVINNHNLTRFTCSFCLFESQGFAPRTAFLKTAQLTSTTDLSACRVNAKKEKIKRNRENMRKFSTPGKKGLSRRKTLKKGQASKARQEENEFIAKCFIVGPVPNSEGK